MKANTQLKFIIAEDDDDDKLLIQDALEENGITYADTMYVDDGLQLLEKLEHPDLYPTVILLDLNMPKKDGRETLREIKNNELLKHIPVVVFTTSNSLEDIKLSYQYGGNTYFTKPPHFSELVEIMGLIKKYWLEKAAIASL
ncbi:response regulator [Abyssalbus ytuae]|uniref:Response regulator n=1 Tax=Abyssalbus ytuae TaxID=2926907 RepID=A0A9E6ZQQ0_9FLAO|nr:response regulator [Abyssalbus ytuae]UOB19174.1 response regulator [Abyssalbus ytuae]